MCPRRIISSISEFLFTNPLGILITVITGTGFAIFLFSAVVLAPTPPGKVKAKYVGSLVTVEYGVTMEKIYDEGTWEVYRMWVPTGWVVFAPRGNSLVPDPNHEWTLNEEEPWRGLKDVKSIH